MAKEFEVICEMNDIYTGFRLVEEGYKNGIFTKDKVDYAVYYIPTGECREIGYDQLRAIAARAMLDADCNEDVQFVRTLTEEGCLDCYGFATEEWLYLIEGKHIYDGGLDAVELVGEIWIDAIDTLDHGLLDANDDRYDKLRAKIENRLKSWGLYVDPEPLFKEG